MTIEEERMPAQGKQSFICPYCEAYAYQHWQLCKDHTMQGHMLLELQKLKTAECTNCLRYSIWQNNKMIYPLTSSAPKPDNNMPEDVKEIYEEARQVHVYSPRAAAALLRVALERLTVHLGESKGKLNTRIGNLQKQGLPPQVIKSLDIVRITANDGGAHSGVIDLTGKDGIDIVARLFKLVNYIIQKTITDPAELEAMFGDLPEDKREGVKNRDKPKDKPKDKT